MATCSENKRPEKGSSLLEFPSDYTVIDLETTGTNPQWDDIIELAALRVRDGVCVDTFSQLVKPPHTIPAMITALTGITNEAVANAPAIHEVIGDFLSFIGNDIIVGHNVHFDVNFTYDAAVKNLGRAVSNPMVDTLRLSRRLLPELERHTLEAVAQALDVNQAGAHRSLVDCETTAAVLNALKAHADVTGFTFRKPERHQRQALSQESLAINELLGLLQGVIADSEVTISEVLVVQEWLWEHDNLQGTYPYDPISDAITSALADGILEQSELEELLKLCQELIDPVGQASRCGSINLNGKLVCLSGDFEHGSKSEIVALLEEKGAVVKSGVVKKLDYLFVGDKGSNTWITGNYGTKIKKAMELQAKGASVQIVRESELFEQL